MPSVIWHCQLGDIKGIQLVKNLASATLKVLLWKTSGIPSITCSNIWKKMPVKRKLTAALSCSFPIYHIICSVIITEGIVMQFIVLHHYFCYVRRFVTQTVVICKFYINTRSCHAHRHYDLEGYSNFSSTIYGFSILCLEHHYCGDQQWRVYEYTSYRSMSQ